MVCLPLFIKRPKNTNAPSVQRAHGQRMVTFRLKDASRSKSVPLSRSGEAKNETEIMIRMCYVRSAEKMGTHFRARPP